MTAKTSDVMAILESIRACEASVVWLRSYTSDTGCVSACANAEWAVILVGAAVRCQQLPLDASTTFLLSLLQKMMPTLASVPSMKPTITELTTLASQPMTLTRFTRFSVVMAGVAAQVQRLNPSVIPVICDAVQVFVDANMGSTVPSGSQ